MSRPRMVSLGCLCCLVGALIPCSTASAADWSTPIPVSGAFTGANPEVAFDPAGNAFVWWTSSSFASMAVAPPDGAFGTPFRPDDPGRTIARIDVDFDSAGNAVVAWVNDLGQLKAARRSPGVSGAFGPPQTVLSGVDPASFQIDVNPQSAALLTWVGPGASAVNAGYSPAGAATAAPAFVTQQVSTVGSTAATPYPVVDPGTAPAAAIAFAAGGAPRQVTTSDASAASPFGAQTPMDAGPPGPAGLSMAANNLGNAVAIWRTDPGGGEQPPSVAVRSPGGSFGTPIPQTSDPVQLHAAAMGANGTGAVVWHEQENDPVPPGCAVGTLSIGLSQSPFASSIFASEEDYNATDPGVAVGPDGTVLVGWTAADCVPMAGKSQGLMARLGSGVVHPFFYGTGTANAATGFNAAFDCSGNALAVWAQGTPSATITGARYTVVSSPPSCATPPDDPPGGDPPGGDPPGGTPPPTAPSNEFEVSKAAAKGDGSVTLTLDLPGAGSVSALATASVAESLLRISKKAKITVAKATATASAAGPLTLKLKPKGKAAKVLKQKGKLKAKTVLDFTPTGGTKSSITETVTFKLKR